MTRAPDTEAAEHLEREKATRLYEGAPGLLAMLKLALPYVEKVAATAPTEMARQQRQRQASKDAAAIRALIAKVEGTS
jgi:hypothetical protein